MKKILATLLLGISCLTAFAQSKAPFTLMTLPYATDALEPVISKQTMELHHGKHLQGYVNNTNKLVEGTAFANKSLWEIVKKSTGSLYNNAGQMLNHNLYFTSFKPNGGGEPEGKLAAAIKAKWGSFDAFKAEMMQKGNSLFGSGWVWLVEKADGKLDIRQYANGGNPVRDGLTPILGFDVWEHAYYLDYNNRRADHLKAIWNIIDWKTVSARYK